MAVPSTTATTRADPNGYYRVLGLNPNEPCFTSDIRAAYRGLIKRYHPDGSEPDPTQFERVQIAYEVLRDSKIRERYDQLDSQTKWLDRKIIEELIRRIARVPKTPSFVEVMKTALVTKASEQVEDVPETLAHHAFYYYEGEPIPPLRYRERWVESIQNALWGLGHQGSEIKVGFTYGTPHIVTKPWGQVLMVSGYPNVSSAFILVRKMRDFS